MTANTILLLDPFGTVEEVEAALGEDARHFRVVRADRPAGDGVFALMVGPETPIPAEAIAALPDLRIVAVTSTGFDHIPLAAVTAQGAWVTTAAGYCTEEVAEHALALLLAGLRRIPALDSSVRAGVWDVTKIAPRRIAGAQVGLVGFGRIAQAVSRRLVALDVAVRAFDPITPDEAFVRLGVGRAESVADAIAGADAVSLHVPLTDETRGMLDADAIATLKPGAFLVNVARGELVDPRRAGRGDFQREAFRGRPRRVRPGTAAGWMIRSARCRASCSARTAPGTPPKRNTACSRWRPTPSATCSTAGARPARWPPRVSPPGVPGRRPPSDTFPGAR